jgi:predicted transcriptional regulator
MTARKSAPASTSGPQFCWVMPPTARSRRAQAPHLSVSASRDYNVRASYVQGYLEMPETTFTFRVDQRLKEAFAEAARANDRPGSQLLRDFMRDYVERAEHDAWFRAEVERSLQEADDPNVELIPHEEVVRTLKTRRAVLIERANRKPER